MLFKVISTSASMMVLFNAPMSRDAAPTAAATASAVVPVHMSLIAYVHVFGALLRAPVGDWRGIVESTGCAKHPGRCRCLDWSENAPRVVLGWSGPRLCFPVVLNRSSFRSFWVSSPVLKRLFSASGLSPIAPAFVFSCTTSSFLNPASRKAWSQILHRTASKLENWITSKLHFRRT